MTWRSFALTTALLCAACTAAGNPIHFQVQVPEFPGTIDAPTSAGGMCAGIELNPRPIFITEPRAGVNSTTGLLVSLSSMKEESDCRPAVPPPDSAWPDQKNVIVADIRYRNRSFFAPYDHGKYQVTDVLRGLGAVLEAYPQIDRRRIYLYGGSGGGQVALQTLQASRHIWQEAVIHCPITRMSTAQDRTTKFYDRDPAPNGWSNNLMYPTAQGDLPWEMWNRYQAERMLRSPQHYAEWDPLTADSSPRITMMHGTADEVVDYQHFLDYQAALRKNASEEELSNWLFVTIHGGLHSYTGASQDENMRYKATNKYLPDAFLSVGEEAPELAVSYTTPGASGWKWRIRGQTLSQTTLTPVFEEVYASGFMFY